MPTRSPADTPITYPTNAEIARKWADITRDRLKKNLSDLKINKSGTLDKSITWSLVSANDKGLHVRFTYERYGMYVDMGVGRGVSVGRRGSEAFAKSRNTKGQLLSYKRKPKKWYSKTMYREVQVLASITSRNYADKAGEIIIQLPRTIEI